MGSRMKESSLRSGGPDMGVPAWYRLGAMKAADSPEFVRCCGIRFGWRPDVRQVAIPGVVEVWVRKDRSKVDQRAVRHYYLGFVDSRVEVQGAQKSEEETDGPGREPAGGGSAGVSRQGSGSKVDGPYRCGLLKEAGGSGGEVGHY